MKYYLLLSLSLLLFSCKVNRYYYIAEEPILLYEFPSFNGSPLLTTNAGDTVYTTGIGHIQLGGSVPVEYKGYKFYSPTAKARFIGETKINPKQASIPATVYTSQLRQKQKNEKVAQSKQDSINYWREQDKIEWYGQASSDTPILDDSFAVANQIGTLKAYSTIRIKRYNYNYWKVTVNGRIGYIAAFRIDHFSKSESPFVRTMYTGRTLHPDGEGYLSNMTNTPTTGAYIHTGPRGGKYYYNSNGNKTYIKRK